jgi:hypothetical protein
MDYPRPGLNGRRRVDLDYTSDSGWAATLSLSWLVARNNVSSALAERKSSSLGHDTSLMEDVMRMSISHFKNRRICRYVAHALALITKY